MTPRMVGDWGLGFEVSTLDVGLFSSASASPRWNTIGASIITSTILEVPYYGYSIMGPETLF